MSEREIKDKVYRILFDKKLDSNTKFNKFVDLVEEYYDLGAKEERQAFVTLFEGDSNLEGLLLDDVEF